MTPADLVELKIEAEKVLRCVNDKVEKAERFLAKAEEERQKFVIEQRRLADWDRKLKVLELRLKKYALTQGLKEELETLEAQYAK